MLPAPAVDLTQDEVDYLQSLGTVKMAVDPDWEPYELVNEQGEYIGIAADFIRLIAERANITLELVPTTNWTQTIEFSQNNQCHIIPFLTKTPYRESWLIFTDSYFSDPMVFITRNEHVFIADPSGLSNETVVLPAGTSTQERLSIDYPNLNIVIVETEREAFQMVEEGDADMTLRSLTMAAYTIMNEGWFNLKIAGQYPDYDNVFRVGVLQSEPMLAAILNKSIATITPQEVQLIVNQHISIEFVTGGTDYGPFATLAIFSSIVLFFFLVYSHQLKRYNLELAKREEELKGLTARLQDHNTELDRVSRAMAKANDKLSMLSSITRHDILNQVMVVQGFMELAEATEMDSKQKKYLQRMLQASENIQKQIEFTREYDQLGVKDPIWYPLSSLLMNVDSTILPVNLECKGISVFADLMISKVFYNLFDNTIRHAADATMVKVHCEMDDEELLVMWEDDGPGVPMDIKNQIFKRGFGANTGLGLFLIREILAITGITILEDGVPGQGVRFVMRVPKGGFRISEKS